MNSAQWLWSMIGLQLILFSIGWLTSARKAREARTAMHRLALFNLGMGTGTALIGLRGILPYVLTHPVSNIVSLASLIMLWRAGQALTARQAATREQIAIFLAGAAAIAWYSGSLQTAQHRVASYFVATAWIASRSGWNAYRGLRAESLHAAARTLLVAGWAMAALFAWRALVGLTGQAQIEFNHASDTNNSMALLVMVAVFTVNTVFAAVIFGRMTAELERQSRRDSLTGLPNRRDIVESLDVEWQRYQRSGVVFSVACLDIDHFKTVNDSHGHAAGDAALIAVSNKLERQVRPGDHLGRSGGEEFLAVLVGCDAAQAQVAAERLCLAVANEPGLHPGIDRRLTISIGVATASPADRSAEALLARADAALYQAKAEGRNRVCQAIWPVRLEPTVTEITSPAQG
ncbi:MAG: GGDEF domain-containing protein [Burkholderiales bacterium]|nr:GGDEF domain-containing protein [Burkholderiales bacterium]